MDGLMMEEPLTIPAILDHAAKVFGDQKVVSVTADGARSTSNYRDTRENSRRLATGLIGLGVNAGDRVATLAWNTQAHLEIYFAAPGVGAVVHTLNPRLTPETLAFIVEQAADRVLFFEPEFLPLAKTLEPLGIVETFVMLGDQASADAADWPGLLSYDELVAASEPISQWVTIDENQAAGLCYTSGTTGNPKGVLYSHRSTVLHALVAALPTNLHLSEFECVLPVVPMFHVNAWGLPFICPLIGAKLVLPRNRLDGASLEQLMREEKVTFAAGVPTIWQGLAQQLEHSGGKLPDLRSLTVGGAAIPGALFDFFRDQMGIIMTQGWGMTETSPLCTFGGTGPQWQDASDQDIRTLKLKQGRPLFGVSARIASPDDAGATPGELLVKGPWIASRYFASDPSTEREWLATGDICEFDEHGYMAITDRAKDLIKSGGEWISSVELEEKACSVEGVAMAAAIAVPDEKWGERPLLAVVAKAGYDLDPSEIRATVGQGLAKWQVPERIEFLPEMPIGPTGKIIKAQLRERFCTTDS